MTDSKTLPIRPYARLLTMLGEQLIKNERIALIELIKNAYDADSPWVKVSFNGFANDFSLTKASTIIIEDNGDGMSANVIENHWLNPATPEKLLRKKTKPATRKGRIIQGEKGIGRFAILKLGRKIKITTKVENENVERIIEYDFSKYDDDFLSENRVSKELFLDQLAVSITTRKPETIKAQSVVFGTHKLQKAPRGTVIEISNLKGHWNEKKVEDVYRDAARLQSIFSAPLTPTQVDQDSFEIWIYKDSTLKNYGVEYLDKLKLLLEDKPVIKIENGAYDEAKSEFQFDLNGQKKVLELKDHKISGLKIFRDTFGKHGEVLKNRSTECGSFTFGFYIFDFTPKAPAKYLLDREDKDIIKDHRIYLYRDGIRVYPYGEPDDDWLKIDIYRGTVSAGQFLSNDQVVGYVNITQKENRRLKDKTNREGLIEEGNASDDFIALLQIFLAYVRQNAYAQYRDGLQEKNAHDVFRTEQVQEEFNTLKAATKNNPKVLALVTKAEKDYRTERKYLVQRAETTEELAGVGLSVETASHDIMAIMHKTINALDYLITDALHRGPLDKEQLQKELQSLRGMVSFIEAQLKDIQLLFKSSKQRRRAIKVKEIVEKIERIYRRLLKKENIELVVQETGSPLIAKTTDAVLLQLFINLFDNAVYWLQQDSRKDKKIEISLDGDKGKLIFSDNGPGVSKEDVPYIFQPFYSGKGEEGRGLGLYIARQLLERHDYAIELADLKTDKILSGANFVASFIAEDK